MVELASNRQRSEPAELWQGSAAIGARVFASGSALIFGSSESSAVVRPVGVCSSPNGSSLCYELCARLPNRTDFAVVGRLGKGAGFRHVAGLAAYHSGRVWTLDCALTLGASLRWRD